MAEKKSPWIKLLPFPTDPPWTANFNLEAQLSVKPEILALNILYKLTGPISEITWPVERTTTLTRNQRLWEHTCFELFLASSSGTPDYQEWNLASSKEYGHYRFHSYRSPSSLNDRLFGGVSEIVFRKSASHAELSARIDLACIEEYRWLLALERSLLCSVTAILENKKGEKSYWATHHAGSKPDFHLKQSMTINFP